MRAKFGWAIAVALTLVTACGGGVNHDNIEEWKGTVKGPKKLMAALSGSHAADLKGHAATNLVAIGEWTEARPLVEALTEAERVKVVADMTPRLTKAATAPEGSAPSPLHAAAKDALFDIRGWADDATRDKIDAYLADWITVNYFDRQARGAVMGQEIIKAVGKRATPKLLSEGKSVLASPPDDQGRIKRFSDELLLAIAYTGDDGAAGFLIDVASVEHVEPTLQRRAMAALYQAYVEDVEPPRASPRALAPHVAKLAAITRDDSQDGGNRNDAFELLAAAGKPECLEPLISLVKIPEQAEAFLWRSVQQGIICVGADGITKIVDAMPENRDYQRGILDKYMWQKMKLLDGRPQLLTSARAMLESSSWVSRITGVELLGMFGGKQDAAAIKALAPDKALLRGWWGPQDDVPAKEKKADPKLGDVALEVADKLESK